MINMQSEKQISKAVVTSRECIWKLLGVMNSKNSPSADSAGLMEDLSKVLKDRENCTARNCSRRHFKQTQQHSPGETLEIKGPMWQKMGNGRKDR